MSSSYDLDYIYNLIEDEKERKVMRMYMEQCKKDTELFNNFIKKYTDTDIDRYDPKILNLLFNNYLIFLSIISSIGDALKKNKNNEDTLKIFEEYNRQHQAAFIMHKTPESYKVFQKYNIEIKFTILLYFYNLYKIHEPIINDFYEHCIDEKTSSRSNPAVVTPESTPPLLRQAWVQNTNQLNHRRFKKLKEAIAEIPKRYGTELYRNPRSSKIQYSNFDIEGYDSDSEEEEVDISSSAKHAFLRDVGGVDNRRGGRISKLRLFTSKIRKVGQHSQSKKFRSNRSTHRKKRG